MSDAHQVHCLRCPSDFDDWGSSPLRLVLFSVRVLLLAANGTVGRNSDTLSGLRQPVEILRDRWGVPHIYAENSDDLFFAQGYIAAVDRLFQLDLWRRAGTGKLAEVLGPNFIPTRSHRAARALSGRLGCRMESYSPDARAIVNSFVAGINAYITSLNGNGREEFRVAGYDPGLWTPEDVVSGSRADCR